MCDKSKMGSSSSSERESQGDVIGTSSLCRQLSTVDIHAPLRFHSTHSDNIVLSKNGSLARRAESFCKGIVFSNRPVRVDERVYLRFAELSVNWSGAIRFGVTNNDPSGLRHSLPKYACPDLTNKPGFWAKALHERLAEPGAVLFYYINQSGDCVYGINDVPKGVFFSGVDVRKPLWALLDVYGNTVGVELINDPHKPLNNARTCDPVTTSSSSSSSEDIDLSQLMHGLNSLINSQDVGNDNLSQQSSFYPGTYFAPLPFHQMHGSNIRLTNDRLVATRTESEYSQGYVFTARPLSCGERIVVKVLHNSTDYLGSMAFGLTTCDPARLTPADLPDDCNQLIDRMEYWVVIKDVANCPKPGDELSFSITRTGEVLVSKNNLPPVTVMHVDQTQKLWAFFDVYGNTQKIKVLGCTVARATSANQRNRTIVNLPEEESAAAQDNAENECNVCCERPVNSVLYTCGHMCMCYDCAKQLHERPSGGYCPICRAEIKDVIRAFRS